MGWPQTVRKQDLRIDRYRGSGKGGQNKNKRDTAVRITHLPTKIVAQAEDERHYEQNLRLAFSRLSEKLVPLMMEAAQEDRSDPNKEVVRTYSEPRQHVRDKRLPDDKFSYKGVLYGKDLDEIIKEILDA